MKKTTWMIMGLSVCVAVLAAALVFVLAQISAEKIIAKEPVPLLKSRSFSISGTFKTKSGYLTPCYDSFIYPTKLRDSRKKLDFLVEKMPGYPENVIFLKRTDQQ